MSAEGPEDATRFFEELWSRGDHWDLETSTYDQDRYERQIALLGGRRYRRVLELGCGAGEFTRRLVEVADSVVAVDVAESAIERARARGLPESVEYRVADAMEAEVEEDGPFDLIVFVETIYYLGWVHTFFDIGWLAWRLLGATEPGGDLLLANTIMPRPDSLESDWLIRTYRDLFANVGFELEREELFSGIKGEMRMDALISLFRKPPGS